jgi:hypothetical protein
VENASEAQGKGVRRRKRKTKVEAFERLKFFQGQEENANAQKGAQQPSDRTKKSGPLEGFHVQEGSSGGARRRTDLNR